MSKFRNLTTAFAAFLLAYVPIVPLNQCGFLWFGEPKLPKKMLQQKENKMI